MASTNGSTQEVAENVDKIIGLEEQAAQKRTPIQAAVESFVAFVGTTPFVAIHVIGFALWIGLNAGLVPGVTAFDPKPFPLLATLVSFEGVVLTAMVLMTQQRTSDLSDHRDHLALQVALLSEREITTTLRLLQDIARTLNVQHDAHEEVRRLAEPTPLDELVAALRDRTNRKGESEGR